MSKRVLMPCLELAQAIRLLATSPQTLEGLSKGARERALQLGSWPGKIAAMMELYQQISTRTQTRGTATS